MTERIWGDLVLEKHDGGMMTVQMQARPMEEIVRCRSCRYFRAYETWASGWCSEWAGETEQDGFCHLGEEKR